MLRVYIGQCTNLSALFHRCLKLWVFSRKFQFCFSLVTDSLYNNEVLACDGNLSILLSILYVYLRTLVSFSLLHKYGLDEILRDVTHQAGSKAESYIGIIGFLFNP